MKSYSQFGEDKHIIGFVPPVGQFLDIGAWSPTTFSNTRALLENGWSGVMVEPSPQPFLNILHACFACGHFQALALGADPPPACPKCGSEERYGTSPRIKLILGAVGPLTGIVKLHITDDALSTTTGTLGAYYAHAWVPQLTLEQIFLKFGSFDFINIDTEGTGIDILFRLFELNIQCSCICAEFPRSLDDAVMAKAAPLGYRQGIRNDANMILVRG